MAAIPSKESCLLGFVEAAERPRKRFVLKQRGLRSLSAICLCPI